MVVAVTHELEHSAETVDTQPVQSRSFAAVTWMRKAITSPVAWKRKGICHTGLAARCKPPGGHINGRPGLRIDRLLASNPAAGEAFPRDRRHAPYPGRRFARAPFGMDRPSTPCVLTSGEKQHRAVPFLAVVSSVAVEPAVGGAAGIGSAAGRTRSATGGRGRGFPLLEPTCRVPLGGVRAPQRRRCERVERPFRPSRDGMDSGGPRPAPPLPALRRLTATRRSS